MVLNVVGSSPTLHPRKINANYLYVKWLAFFLLLKFNCLEFDLLDYFEAYYAIC